MKYLSFLLLLTIPFFINAQTTPMHESVLEKAAPEEVGLSPDRLNRIRTMMASAIENEEIPGAVMLIARNGKIAMLEAMGSRDAEGTPLKTDDIFRIASQTKAITATAVMILWEEGKFRLDDPISRYLPEFENTGVLETYNEADTTFTITPLESPITIRHLITHTSGIGYGFIDGDPRFKAMFWKAGIYDGFTTDEIRIEDNVKKIATMPLHHAPGDSWTYSEGLDVLGRFIEVMSGMPLDEFFAKRIFEPLGMTDTYFYLPESKRDRLVTIQTWKEKKWVNFDSHPYYDPDYPMKGAQSFFSGGAGLSSTATDYARFLQMYLNNGKYNGSRVLSRTTIDIIMQNQIGNLWEGNGGFYGLAFRVIDDVGAARGGSGSKGTFDWGGYFNTQYFADPEEQVIGILMKQTLGIPNDQTGWRYRQMVFQAIDD